LDQIFSADPNLDLPLPMSNPSMTDLCGYYNDPEEAETEVRYRCYKTFFYVVADFTDDTP
jgi:hypothetical protein